MWLAAPAMWNSYSYWLLLGIGTLFVSWLFFLLGTLWLDDCSSQVVLSYFMATQGHCMVAFVGCSILLVLSCVTGYF